LSFNPEIPLKTRDFACGLTPANRLNLYRGFESPLSARS